MPMFSIKLAQTFVSMFSGRNETQCITVITQHNTENQHPVFTLALWSGGGRDGKYFKLLVLTWIVFGLAYFASILTMIANWLRVLSKKTRAEVRL